MTSNEVHFVSLADNFTVQFSNLLKLLSTLGARGFFLVGGDRIERRSREGESQSGEKKTSGTNGYQPHFHSDANFR